MRMMSFYEFYDLLKELGLTQREFAQIVDVHERTVRSWASGRYAIPEAVALVLRLAKVTGVKLDDERLS